MSEKRQTTPPSAPGTPLPVDAGQPSVPAFGCIVYFRNDQEGFHGRVVNLSGIEVSATSQRDMLGQIVSQFKAAVSQCLSEGETPNWIDPPPPPADGEKKVFLPVHL